MIDFPTVGKTSQCRCLHLTTQILYSILQWQWPHCRLWLPKTQTLTPPPPPPPKKKQPIPCAATGENRGKLFSKTWQVEHHQHNQPWWRPFIKGWRVLQIITIYALFANTVETVPVIGFTGPTYKLQIYVSRCYGLNVQLLTIGCRILRKVCRGFATVVLC
jgi:hypothetical protein